MAWQEGIRPIVEGGLTAMGGWAVRREQLRHWAQMLQGRSYWEVSTGPGPGFVPGEIEGYYRDYSGKTCWQGAVDDAGIPLVREPGGAPFHHPLVLAQKALGHWTCRQADRQHIGAHEREFLRLANVLLGEQATDGGWTIPSMAKSVYTVPRSAMAQGQVASVLVRAWFLARGDQYIEGAKRGLEYMLVPIDRGGTTRPTASGPVFEEYPQERSSSVLNGWVSALFGLYDYGLADANADFDAALQRSTSALVARLPRYDAGFWSYYNLHGAFASPYYHAVHITQLRALELCLGAHATSFAVVRERFEKQQASTLCAASAFILKAAQKLRERQPTVLIQPRRCGSSVLASTRSSPNRTTGA